MKKKTTPLLTAWLITDFLKQPSYTPLKKNELFRALRLGESQRIAFRHALKRLLDSGDIIKVRKNCYAIAGTAGLVVGILRANESGFGFVISETPGNPDIYIPRHGMSTAMHGDKVLVRADEPAGRQDPSKGPSGMVARVLERANTTIVGTLARSEQFTYVIPDDPRLFQDIYVDKRHLKGAAVNDRVMVRVTQWPSKHVSPEGIIEEVLGPNSDPRLDLTATLRKYNYQTAFPDAVLREANAIGLEILPQQLKGRVDLREKIICTIDPEDAKDFDDAVSLEEDKNGVRLGVHIADVSAYVGEGTALDKEARGRGTSVYLPGCVLPMLPERLSNGVCSLKEGEDRLTKTALFHCSTTGEIQKVEVFPSVIRSAKRFTYEEVLKIISGKESAAHAAPSVRPLIPMLHKMAALADHLHHARLRRGAILLNIPKVKVLLDAQYRAIGVRKEVGDQAHSLIEEFMLLANEAVCRYIVHKSLPCIYRIHETPDKQSFEEFAVFVRGLGYPFHTHEISVHAIQNLLNRIEGKPEEAVIHIQLLRAMKLAVYSQRNAGHFALALKFYTHFTSPIRRYPDLIVHRILDRIWRRDAQGKMLAVEEIATLAAHSSRMERQADEAERGLTRIKVLQYLAHLAEHHSRKPLAGVITGVKSFGFFVELEETLVEGMVHLSSIKDDFYDANIARQTVIGRRRHRKFHLGQRVSVRIAKVDMAKRQVDFTLV